MQPFVLVIGLDLPLRAVRRAGRGVGRVVDTILHPTRHRRELERLGGQPASSILFLCHGNVCRSPYAEVVFRRMGGDGDVDVAVDSAGFIGPGRPPPEEALRAAARRGVDMNGHRSKLTHDVALEEFDVIVVMNTKQKRDVAELVDDTADTSIVVLGDLDPSWGTLRAIRDPWGQEDRVFDEVYERIDRCLGTLLEAIRASP